ncbi:hypothetical protein EV363DRAFT_1397028 [Boletus edulis]|nr:hypothetical protein EV363DRAFT_1397028 [Boletus edulis]
MSSPSSASSCADSQSLSPPTPDSYFSPTPAIVCPDEFTLQMEIQLDELAVPPPKTDPCFLSGDDMNKLQVFLRNKGRWGNMYNQFESSPPVQPDSTCDDFAWEATQSALIVPNQLPDPSRCSLLIHEVSLLVGVTDDDYLSPDDACPLVPDASKQVHDILPLTPTKSLAYRKPSLPHLTNTNPPLLSSPSATNPSLYNQGPPPVGSRDLATPIPRYKNPDAERPSSPRRRHGQVFHFEPPLPNAPHRNALDLDQTFCSPRAPPPKPTPTPSANRCSSLDRLECSLLKLEAHAPRNHRKSRSEGRSSDRVPQRENKRPSLPPPRHLKKRQSSHEIVPHHLSRSTHGRHFSGPAPPVPRPILPHQSVAPPIRPAAPLDDDLFEEDVTPGSFMDMDIPHIEEAGQKRRASFRQVKCKERIKNLVSAAKRVSRGVIAWGNFLTGSTKPAQEASTIQCARV